MHAGSVDQKRCESGHPTVTQAGREIATLGCDTACADATGEASYRTPTQSKARVREARACDKAERMRSSRSAAHEYHANPQVTGHLDFR